MSARLQARRPPVALMKDAPTMTTANAASPAAPALLPICDERTVLCEHLVPTVLEYALPGAAQSVDVQRNLRCTLQQHTTDEHYGFVLHLDGTNSGSVWARWTGRHEHVTVTVLPDCDAVGPGPDYDACCEFGGHPGGHTHEIEDPALMIPLGHLRAVVPPIDTSERDAGLPTAWKDSR